MFDTKTSIVLVALLAPVLAAAMVAVLMLAAMIVAIMARGFIDALCAVIAIERLIAQKLASSLPPGISNPVLVARCIMSITLGLWVTCVCAWPAVPPPLATIGQQAEFGVFFLFTFVVCTMTCGLLLQVGNEHGPAVDAAPVAISRAGRRARD